MALTKPKAVFIVDGSYIQDSFKARRGSDMSGDVCLKMLEYAAATLGVDNVQTYFVDGDPDKWYSKVARGRTADLIQKKNKRIVLHDHLRHQRCISSRVTVELCDFKKQSVGYNERGERLQGWVQGGDVMIVRRMLKTAFENSRIGARESAASSSAECSDGITTIVLVAGDKDFSDIIDDCRQLGLKVAICGYEHNMAGELKEKPNEIRIIYLDQWPADSSEGARQRKASSPSTRLQPRPTPQPSFEHGGPFANRRQAPPAGGDGSFSGVAAAAVWKSSKDVLDRIFPQWLGRATELKVLYRSSHHGVTYGDLLDRVGAEKPLAVIIHKDQYHFGVYIKGGLQLPDDPSKSRTTECRVWYFSLTDHFGQPTKIDIDPRLQFVEVAGREGSVNSGCVSIGGRLQLGVAHCGRPAGDLFSCCQLTPSCYVPAGYMGLTNSRGDALLGGSELFHADAIEVFHVGQ
ncbi:unnamed protein product [Vitrella brassicaformis CCMP3155]|uniref:Uncharacterized protein n=1 Tax=Vitrella brassicaformis (strain CCMP3155) TaxID=1169540 RepID=A0A0G4GTV1_VITBC|nr:unnamed protein product [Vitrella brassicaformis CCMP3155]|eukprot:CEM34027.1 unnamed protein product [Vitrella brassicaformis CCMP3155]